MLKALLTKYVAYNFKMNQAVIQAMQTLGEDNCKKSQGAFFDSILATANHIMLADLIWLNRFKLFMSEAVKTELMTFPKPMNLNEILCENLADYQQQCEELDKLIIKFIEM